MLPIDKDHELSIENAKLQFNNIVRQRDALTRELVVIRHHITTLSKLTKANEVLQRFLMNMDEIIWPPHGATDAVRFALRICERPVTAWEIKDVLHERGFDWRRYTNPAGVVQNAVKGMLKRGEASMTVLPDGTKTYAWTPKEKRRSAVQK